MKTFILFLAICCIVQLSSAQQWVSLGDYSSTFTPRFVHATVSLPNENNYTLLTIGGQDSEGIAVNDNQILEFSANNVSTTRTASPLPIPVFGHSAVVYEDAVTNETMVLVYGGGNQVNETDPTSFTVYSDFQLYSVRNNNWTTITVEDVNNRTGRYNHRAVVYNNTMWIYGGVLPDATTRSNQFLCLDLTTLELTNCRRNTLIPALSAHSMVLSTTDTASSNGPAIYVFGGYNGTHDTNSIFRYVFDLHGWSEIKCSGECPAERSYHSAVDVGHGMVISGGILLNKGEVYPDTWYYNYDQNVWLQLTADITPNARFGATAAAIRVPANTENIFGVTEDSFLLAVIAGQGVSGTNFEINAYSSIPVVLPTGESTTTSPPNKTEKTYPVGQKLLGGAMIIVFVAMILGLAFFFKRQNR